MPKYQYTKTALKEAIAGKLQRHFGREVADASKACALVVRDALTEHMIETQNEVEKYGERQVHYLCMEFLVGRSLRNNAYNLGILPAMTEALKEMGYEMADIFEEEADPGLGNGGLGRLAACYMDGMASIGVRGTGYSIRYEHGIFKQKIIDGWQMEFPDDWLTMGDVWLVPREDEAVEVKFGGEAHGWDDNGVFNFEGGCYAKVINLDKDAEPDIYNAIKRNALLENVTLDESQVSPQLRYDRFLPGRLRQGPGGRHHGRGHLQGPLSCR